MRRRDVEFSSGNQGVSVYGGLRHFDGLSMMAEHVIHCNPFSGHLLVFCNRRSDRLKILYWDRDGGRSGTRGWKRVLSSFLSPRPGGRRSRPGSWVCGWKESILVRGGEENA